MDRHTQTHTHTHTHTTADWSAGIGDNDRIRHQNTELCNSHLAFQQSRSATNTTLAVFRDVRLSRDYFQMALIL